MSNLIDLPAPRPLPENDPHVRRCWRAPPWASAPRPSTGPEAFCRRRRGERRPRRRRGCAVPPALDLHGPHRPAVRRRGSVLTLTAVTDVLGALTDPSLRGHEDAFTLEFEGRADALPDDVYEVVHAQIGPFPLFLGPAAPSAGWRRRYCATVDRTVKVKGAPSPADEGGRGGPRRLRDGGERAKGAADAPPSPRDEEIIAERAAAAAAPAILAAEGRSPHARHDPPRARQPRPLQAQAAPGAQASRPRPRRLARTSGR